jgi:hypothetical protein
MKQIWRVRVDVNGGEYVSLLLITAKVVEQSARNPRVLYADRVRVETDEQILSIEPRAAYVDKDD